MFPTLTYTFPCPLSLASVLSSRFSEFVARDDEFFPFKFDPSADGLKVTVLPTFGAMKSSIAYVSISMAKAGVHGDFALPITGFPASTEAKYEAEYEAEYGGADDDKAPAAPPQVLFRLSDEGISAAMAVSRAYAFYFVRNEVNAGGDPDDVIAQIADTAMPVNESVSDMMELVENVRKAMEAPPGTRAKH